MTTTAPPRPAFPRFPRPRTFRAIPAQNQPFELVATSRAHARRTLAELFRDTDVMQVIEVGDW